MQQPLVIVGSGLAGYTAAREWRKLDRERALVLVTADDGSFYSKPMLSNALAGGKTPQQLASFSAEQMAAQLQAEILIRHRVLQLDIDNRTLRLRSDTGAERTLAYGQLVLALGADPVRLPLNGDAGNELLAINDLQDYKIFRQRIADAKSLLVLGAGFVGCEFANDLLLAGYQVTVADPMSAPMQRLVPPAIGQGLAQALEQAGAQWRLGWAAAAVDHHADQLRVTLRRLADGAEESLVVDRVVAAVGLRPRRELAQAAGLKTERGIVTDACLATSASGVYALGDCAEINGELLPFVMPIMHCARALAKTLCGQTTPVVFPAMPIVVKTPAYPNVVVIPPANVAGEWRSEQQDGGAKSLFIDSTGKLRGFALGGTAVGEKAGLLQTLNG